MFTAARLKLTAWYLIIIMAISAFFSVFIYRVLSNEIDRFARGQRVRIERRFFNGDFYISPPQVDLDLIDDTKKRLIISLGVINAAILGISGTLGYFLAGKTLDPIHKMIEEQNRFISDSSHELRTPLAAMKSSLEINLRDKKLNLRTARKLIEDNVDQVNRLAELTDKLLGLTKIEGTDQSNHLSTIFISKSINSVIKDLKPLAAQKNITLQNLVKKTAVIKGDNEQILQLFSVLIENAIKYSNDNKVVKIVSAVESKNISIQVIDQGIGIDPIDQPYVFNRFFRSDKSRAHKNIGGYGLGLSIAKKIAQAHNATISLLSKVGEGSVFTVCFQK